MDIVAGEIGHRHTAPAQLVDGRWVDHPIHQIGEDQIEGSVGMFAAEGVHHLLAEAGAQRGVVVGQCLSAVLG